MLSAYLLLRTTFEFGKKIEMQHWYNERHIGMLYNETIAYIFNAPKYGVVLCRICPEAYV